MKRKIDFDSSNGSSRSSKGFDADARDGMNPWTGKPLSKRYYDILEKRKQLPVYEFKEALEKAVTNNQVVIVEVSFCTIIRPNLFFPITETIPSRT
jgi:pre-mRNA-splicing factor ATP-dependent RNA helicase DHX15/PRP43